MEVEIWSDVVCPWCYIGKRRFESAMDRFEHADEVTVIWRSFELNPNAPKSTETPLIDLIAKKYSISVEQVVESNRHITALAEAEGLTYRLDLAKNANSFDAHRLIHLANGIGLGDLAEERLFSFYFSEGGLISDRENLIKIGVEIGIEQSSIESLFSTNLYEDDVRSDEALAQELGISGVPFFAIDRRYAISGAQDTETMVRALDAVWKTTPKRTES